VQFNTVLHIVSVHFAGFLDEHHSTVKLVLGPSAETDVAARDNEEPATVTFVLRGDLRTKNSAIKNFWPHDFGNLLVIKIGFFLAEEGFFRLHNFVELLQKFLVFAELIGRVHDCFFAEFNHLCITFS
jgi:hypothetical protein